MNKQAILFLNTDCDLFKHDSGHVVQMLSVSAPPPSPSPTGRDGRGRTDPDGRRIRGWGRTPNHPFGEHSVWRHQRPGRRGRFQQLPSFGQQRPLEQQTSCCSGHQSWEHSATTIAVKLRILGYIRTDSINSPGLNQNLPPTVRSAQIRPPEYFPLLRTSKTRGLAALHSNIHVSQTFSARQSCAPLMNCGVFKNAFGKQQINFFCSDLQTRSSHLLEYNSCDWMTWRSQVIMLTVERVGEKDHLKRQTKCLRKWQVALCVGRWKQLTALKTNETLLEVFFFGGLLAVSLFLPLLYFHFQLRGIRRALCCCGLGNKGKSRPWIVFFPVNDGRRRLWFHANQFDCAHSLLVFCLSQNSLWLQNFKDHHWNFANYAMVWFFFFLFREKIGLCSL